MATKNNPTSKERPSSRVELGEAVADASVLIAIKSDGEAYMATDVAGEIVIGVNEQSGAEGDYVVVNADIVLLKNDADNPITAANIGGPAYVHGTDGETVCVSAGSVRKLIAGKVVDVVTEGVYVDTNVQTFAAASA